MTPAATMQERHLQDVLLRVGQLNYTWTNTESLLIHLMAGLARTDKDTATIIFLTLNTTRARLDLVDRLAKMERTPKELREDILGVTSDLARESALRNKYNHCIYSFDAQGGALRTIHMRVSDRPRAIRYGKSELVDDTELENIAATIVRIHNVNRAIWHLITKYGFPS